jgi:hypothetical protein
VCKQKEKATLFRWPSGSFPITDVTECTPQLCVHPESFLVQAWAAIPSTYLTLGRFSRSRVGSYTSNFPSPRAVLSGLTANPRRFWRPRASPRGFVVLILVLYPTRDGMSSGFSNLFSRPPSSVGVYPCRANQSKIDLTRSIPDVFPFLVYFVQFTQTFKYERLKSFFRCLARRWQ